MLYSDITKHCGVSKSQLSRVSLVTHCVSRRSASQLLGPLNDGPYCSLGHWYA